MAYAITLNTEIINQAGYPVKSIISESHVDLSTDGKFYSFGDMVIRVELIQAIVKMKNKVQDVEVLHG